jgi:hypothetical protein
MVIEKVVVALTVKFPTRPEQDASVTPSTVTVRPGAITAGQIGEANVNVAVLPFEIAMILRLGGLMNGGLPPGVVQFPKVVKIPPEPTAGSQKRTSTTAAAPGDWARLLQVPTGTVYP